MKTLQVSTSARKAIQFVSDLETTKIHRENATRSRHYPRTSHFAELHGLRSAMALRPPFFSSLICLGFLWLESHSLRLDSKLILNVTRSNETLWRYFFPTERPSNNVAKNWVPYTSDCLIEDRCWCFHVEGSMSKVLNPKGAEKASASGAPQDHWAGGFMFWFVPVFC